MSALQVNILRMSKESKSRKKKTKTEFKEKKKRKKTKKKKTVYFDLINQLKPQATL